MGSTDIALGGGPFVVMTGALRAVFPEAKPPTPPEVFVVLSDPVRLSAEMTAAGFTTVEVVEMTTIWQGPAGQSYWDELRELHGYMPPFAALNADDQGKVERAILEIIAPWAVNGQVKLPAPVLIASRVKEA